MGLAALKTTSWLFFLICSVQIVSAEESCYGAGSIATSVVLSVLITLLIVGAVYYWIKRKPHTEHLILETDPEKGKAEYAFDNPGFKDAGLSPLTKTLEKAPPKFESEKHGKQRWNHWPGLSVLTTKSEKRKILDDSVIEGSEVKVVALRSHDFTGLGFNICGNMKEGIYIKDILHRGPASESGKLNQGDRINSVTISFEHIVYEDALTILSYASPYEVIIEAKSGKIQIGSSSKSNQPRHPIYRSSSTIDLQQIDKSARRKLYSVNSMDSSYSTLHKSMSNMTTLERNNSNSPKRNEIHLRSSHNNTLNSEQLKNQLEQKITYAETEARLKNEPLKIEIETQKTENKHQKFGIKVFPTDQHKNTKGTDLSVKDNNINVEKNQTFTGIDEVDATKPQPEKRTKKTEEVLEKTEQYFRRNDSTSGSGLKRDANGIPQEIPSHMLNAAVAARRNRRSSEEILANDEDTKTPKKLKGKAPAPPPEEKNKISAHSMTGNLDEIKQADESSRNLSAIIPIAMEISVEKENNSSKKNSLKEYNSDSDEETDNQSSVNTIELNSSDITIHHEENEEKQNRKTASTGDLTKIQKTRKSSTGTLERAQSLDITDASIPTLNKKRKGGRIEDTFDMKSDEDLFGKAMLNKEPRLSLILDGLNTFQRNRLKKSTEWGNLEDAILKSSNDDNSISPVFDQKVSTENLNFNFGEKSAELDALVIKINEIRRESQELQGIIMKPPESIEMEEPLETNKVDDIPKNQIWPSEINKPVEIDVKPVISVRSNKTPSLSTAPAILRKPKVWNDIWPKELDPKSEIDQNSKEEKETIVVKPLIDHVQYERNDHKNIEENIELIFANKNAESGHDENNDQGKQEIIQIKTSTATIRSKDKDIQPVQEPIEMNTVNYVLPDRTTDKIKEVVSVNIKDDNVQSQINVLREDPVLVGSITKTLLAQDMIESEAPPEEILDVCKNNEMQTDLDDVIEVVHNHKNQTELNIQKIEILPNRTTLPSGKMKIHKRQQIPRSEDEILPPPGMSESNLEQEIFEELRRHHSESSDAFESNAMASNNRILDSETSSTIETSDSVLSRSSAKYPGPKRNSETGEIYTEINNTDESKTTTLNNINPRYLDDTENFLLNERYLCGQDEPYEILPEDTNISDDIKVSRHSLGSLERAKSDDAKSIESVKYLSNVSNVTISSVQTENGSSSLHSLEFSVNEPTDERDHSRASENSELYTTALNKTVKVDRDSSKITISTPDLIKNVTIAEAISTLNSDMDQSSSVHFGENMEEKHTLTNGGHNATKVSDDNKTLLDSSSNKSHSSLTYITEIQVTPNNGNATISEIEIVPSLNAEPKQYSRNLDNEFENYVKNFEVKNLVTNKDVKIKNEELKETEDLNITAKIDPEKELHKIKEIAQEQLKKLPEMRFSTSSYESPSRIPEKRQSQIELLKSNFEKSPPKPSKADIATKSRIPISTTMKTPPTSPERRDSRNLDIENEKDILALMSSTVQSTPMTNSLKYQKSANKNVTITSIRNNSKIPSGLPVLGGNRPPIPPRKPDQDNDNMIVQVSTNSSNINSFKQWVFDPVDSVTNISLSGQKPEHK